MLDSCFCCFWSLRFLSVSYYSLFPIRHSQKLRWFSDIGYKQLIPSTGHGNIQKLKFTLVGGVKIALIAHLSQYKLIRNDDLAGIDNKDDFEFETFGTVHGSKVDAFYGINRFIGIERNG